MHKLITKGNGVQSYLSKRTKRVILRSDNSDSVCASVASAPRHEDSRGASGQVICVCEAYMLKIPTNIQSYAFK